jgi:formylglycine-generating enzyme required for sulfatase activity
MKRLFSIVLAAAFVTLASHLPIQAQEKKDPPKDFTNSIGMKFVWIKPGSFMMGSPKEEKERGSNETQHKVTLTKGFYMGVHLVTQEQWKEIMGNNPSHFKAGKNLPVETVSWDDCQQFIKKLREKDKKPYRLPSEAEWEYACRAGTTTPFHFGQTSSDFIYGDGKRGKYLGEKTPVGSYPANAWGIHDLHGNVWQGCQAFSGKSSALFLRLSLASKPKMKLTRPSSFQRSRCLVCEKSVSPRMRILRKPARRQVARARSSASAAPSCEGRLPGRLMMRITSAVLARVMING